MEAYEMRTPLTVRRDGAVAELSAALRREKRSVNQVRLRGALAVARGHRVPAVAQTLGVAERAVRNWVHRYNQRGLAGLADRRTGRRPRLSGKQIEQLRERIRAGPRPDDGVCSLRGCDIRRILREEFRARYARSSVYYLLHHQLRLSYLKPRPLHRKTDPVAQEDFKKTSRKGSKTSGKRTSTGGWKSGSRMKAASVSKDR